MRAIVFSRNRPLQLEGLLDSLAANAPWVVNDGVHVLFRADTFAFLSGYRKVAHEHPWARLRAQGDDFTDDLNDMLADATRLVVFFTDDDVMFRQPLIGDIEELGPEVIAFSWRLGRNTTFCYPLDTPQPVPMGMTWRWEDAQLDFSYPMSLDGHVFRTGEIEWLVGDHRFRGPNDLEAHLAGRAAELQRPFLCCDTLSSVVGLPVNRVNDTHPNRAGSDPAHTADALLAAFAAGYRLDWRRMDWSGVDGAHWEQPLLLAQREEIR